MVGDLAPLYKPATRGNLTECMTWWPRHSDIPPIRSKNFTSSINLVCLIIPPTAAQSWGIHFLKCAGECSVLLFITYILFQSNLLVLSFSNWNGTVPLHRNNYFILSEITAPKDLAQPKREGRKEEKTHKDRINKRVSCAVHFPITPHTLVRQILFKRKNKTQILLTVLLCNPLHFLILLQCPAISTQSSHYL